MENEFKSMCLCGVTDWCPPDGCVKAAERYHQYLENRRNTQPIPLSEITTPLINKYSK